MDSNLKVLVVDDEKLVCDSCESILSDEGLQVQTALSGRDGLRRLESESFNMLVTDLRMPEIDGLELIERARAKLPSLAVIAITGYPSPETAVRTLKAGALEYLPKPFTPEEFVGRVRSAFDKHKEFLDDRARGETTVSPRIVRRAIDESRTKPSSGPAIAVDLSKCMTCRSCVVKCRAPHLGPSTRVSERLRHPFGAIYPRAGKQLILECNLCVESLRAGKSPICVQSCPRGALTYEHSLTEGHGVRLHRPIFSGKKIEIVALEQIAADPDPTRPTEIYSMVLAVGPEWGQHYQPGQFVMLRAREGNERVPLTVTKYDPGSGHLTLVFQVVGVSTHRLSRLTAGDTLEDLTSPLGTPIDSHLPVSGQMTAILVAGGVGIAPAYAKLKMFHDAGFSVVTIVGARNRDLLFMLDDMRALSHELIITTDDGSFNGPEAGHTGAHSGDPASRKLFPHQILDQLIDYEGKGQDNCMPRFRNRYRADEIAEVFAVGPVMLMKAVAETARPMGIRTSASVNPVMLDGSGMCGRCIVNLLGGNDKKGEHQTESVWTCIQGPTFDAQRVDFDALFTQLRTYADLEALSQALLEMDQPLDEISVRSLQEIPGSSYLLKLARHLAKPETMTVGHIVDAMRARFEHVAGYRTLDEAVACDAEACRCPPSAERKRNCQKLCPVDVNVPMFVKHLKAAAFEAVCGLPEFERHYRVEDFQLEVLLRTVEQQPDSLDPRMVENVDRQVYEAFTVITASNPIPEITGLVCPQEKQCQSRCARILGKPEKRKPPVSIGRLEAFVAHWVRVHLKRMEKYPWFKGPVPAAATGKQVMIVGSGPAALVAAADLAHKGHAVTVFETLHEAGGVLTYGIPEFRLPKEIVRHEIAQIAALGVRFMLNHPVKHALSYMRSNGFHAAFLATGAGTPYRIGIKGENLKGVYSANEILARVNLMDAYIFPKSDTPPPDILGRDVVVFGGGNVALDAARCALRLGARSTTIMYRRTEEELPARREEVEHAQEEGVRFEYLITPTELVCNDNCQLRAVKYYRNTLGEKDASGRARPVPDRSREYETPVGAAVVAIGQGPNQMMDPSAFDMDRKGRLIVDPESLATSLPGVFAGGDIVADNDGTVIYAAGCGLRAAQSIDRYLKTVPTWSVEEVALPKTGR